MNRQEAAIEIARFNMFSKKIYTAIHVNDMTELKNLLRADYDFESVSKELILYIRRDPDPLLYNQLIKLTETRSVLTFISNCNNRSISFTLETMATSIEDLRSAAHKIDSAEKYVPDMDYAISDKETIELLSRAQKAQYLDEELKPLPTTKLFELKLIAAAIIGIKKLQTRDSWVHFNRLWGIRTKSLAAIAIPLTKGKEIYEVSKLYPEFNMMELVTCEDERPVFISPFTPEQAEVLLLTLKRHKFIGRSTSKDIFLAIQGLSGVAPGKINWIGSPFSLAYFIK